MLSEGQDTISTVMVEIQGDLTADRILLQTTG